MIAPSAVFTRGEAAPGLPKQFSYRFAIPAIVTTSRGSLLAFAQAELLGGTVETLDGRRGWTDIVARRSTDDGNTWGDLQVLCRNSSLQRDGTRNRTLEHSCQQPAPVVDKITGKIIMLSSLDNWFQRAVSSTDDGVTWTPWAKALDLDGSLRRPGWGLVYNGLPGGIQLRPPSKHAGRLVVCSSAYWSGGKMVDGKIVSPGDVGSRYSFTMLSDDGGASWRIGSAPIQPYHTTECSVAQSFDGDGALYLYTRIWAHKPGEARRGIAKSMDGGETWDAATLRGLGDTAPDCEGSMLSAVVGGETCFFVSSPWSAQRRNLTVQASCGLSAPSAWSEPIVVVPGDSAYSSLALTSRGQLLDLYWSGGDIRMVRVTMPR